MKSWIVDLSLKYKFWAVNLVAFATSLLLVLFALHQEQQGRNHSAQLSAYNSLRAVNSSEVLWQAAAYDSLWTDNPTLGHFSQPRNDGERVTLPVYGVSLQQVFQQRALSYAICVLGLMLLLMAASQLLISFILGHLHQLKNVMQHVEHSGDLTVRASVASHDEVGQMAQAFNAMQSGYQSIVSTVAQAAASLDNRAHTLANNMRHVRSGMLAQQSETDQTATAINEMSTTVHHIAQHASATRDQSAEADRLSGIGQQVVQHTSEAISALSIGVQQSAETISRLADDSRTISSVVETIHGIAEQTNLLALNAAIEAARAGEMGRGFAVVADEVRNLAKRVQASTDEITRMIGNLQATSRDAVEFMQESSHKADECVQQAGNAADALSHIAQAVALMRESNTQIAVAAEQQSQVAEEMTRSVIGIRDVTEQTVDKTLSSANTSEELVKLAGELTHAIGRLKL